MPQLQFTNKCVLEISPILETPDIFASCIIKESILGPLPDLTLVVKTSEDLCKLNDEIKGSIINKDGNSTTFIGYVYSISHANDKCVIKILCVKPDFVNKENTNYFESANKAIEGLYFDKKKIEWWNAKYDQLNNVAIFQKDITNYNILKKCLNGYNKDTIYGFALGDLRLNDLGHWKLRSDEYKFASKLNIQPTTASELVDHKLYNKDIKFIDYSNKKDPNHKIIKFYDKHIPVNIEYEDLIANTLYNSKFRVMRNTVNYNAMELFPFNITDSVKVGNDDNNPKNNCFISSRTISFFSNGVLQVDYTIQSIDPLGTGIVPVKKAEETPGNITSPPSKGEYYSSEDLGIIS